MYAQPTDTRRVRVQLRGSLRRCGGGDGVVEVGSRGACLGLSAVHRPQAVLCVSGRSTVRTRIRRCRHVFVSVSGGLSVRVRSKCVRSIMNHLSWTPTPVPRRVGPVTGGAGPPPTGSRSTTLVDIKLWGVPSRDSRTPDLMESRTGFTLDGVVKRSGGHGSRWI